MKKLALLLTMLVFLNACQENEPVQRDLTGNETTYALLSGSTYPVNGTVTFQELKDGTTRIRVALSGTEGSIKHPVHLHLGNIATPDADVAALLNPVPGQTGISETTLKQLADESPVTYQQLVQLNACIKIHLAESGPDKNIILAGGNIGSATSDDSSVGRAGMRACKSE
jgi:hypothetical protein